MAPNSARATGSVGDIRERLLLWCGRAESGLARVEFTDEFIRRRVLVDLRRALDAAGIPLHEVTLPTGLAPTQLVRDLLTQLEAFAPGVVSIDGFVMALPANPQDLKDALYHFNFSRERLSQPRQRQIWWMPQYFADAFARAVPDLDSWFLVKLRLTETSEIRAFDTFVDRGMSSSSQARENISPAQARKQAERLVERLERGMKRQLDPTEMEATLLLPALTVLAEAGLTDDAAALERRFRPLRSSSRTNVGNEVLDAEAGLSQGSDLIRRGQQLHESLRFPDAESAYRSALALLEIHAADKPEYATALSNLAQLLQATNRLAEAEPLMRRALAIDETSYGAEHPNVGIRLNNLAQLLQDTNRLAEAEPLTRRALAIDETSYGAEHPSVAIRLNNLAQLLQATNRLAEAEPLMRHAVEILLRFKQATGHDNPNLAAGIKNYRLLLAQMDYTPERIEVQLNEIAAPFGSHFADGAA